MGSRLRRTSRAFLPKCPGWSAVGVKAIRNQTAVDLDAYCETQMLNETGDGNRHRRSGDQSHCRWTDHER
jgi:hypothetical protein